MQSRIRFHTVLKPICSCIKLLSGVGRNTSSTQMCNVAKFIVEFLSCIPDMKEIVDNLLVCYLCMSIRYRTKGLKVNKLLVVDKFNLIFT